GDDIAGMRLPVADNLRIERLTGAKRAAERGKIIAREILLREKAVDGWRRAEGGYPELFKQPEMKDGIERPLPVIENDLRPGKKRREEEPPGRLRPAGVGQRPVHLARAKVHPEERRCRMGERIGD